MNYQSKERTSTSGTTRATEWFCDLGKMNLRHRGLSHLIVKMKRGSTNISEVSPSSEILRNTLKMPLPDSIYLGDWVIAADLIIWSLSCWSLFM